MPQWNPRANELFLQAIEFDTPEARQAFLKEGCGTDAELRKAVGVLLAAHLAAGSFLEQPFSPADDATETNHPNQQLETKDHIDPKASIGQVIAGKYKLIEEIGEGGMGSVYMAQQTEPVKRAVAVKVIKAGMDSKAVLARFEAERQALAVMDHPNIAKVLDAGTTDGGQPFFVMELVKGLPITEFCDARKLTPRQRLELFVPVCQAIQHAHMKGVIHRDIKPSNVLVALYDDRPVPKVIDFGVAKAAGQSLTDKTLMTGFGAVVGTPEYMSPEQASLNNLDIDTRSDVYSLGVLLYELLTGTTPVDRKSLGKAALLEVLRIVREVEAPRPSVKLSTADARASLSADRGMEPKKLTGLLRNELDWIVVKALEKDRVRRYESANGFAADVQRYLAGEAVQAHPPTLGYRLKKAYRRNKALLLTGVAFALVLLAGIAMSSWLALKATRAEVVAEANATEAKQNADAWAKVSELHLAAMIEAEIRSLGSRVDFDLAEYKNDPRVGLLRLARPLNHTYGPLPSIEPNVEGSTHGSFAKHPRYRELREFQTAAVISAGQEYAPLMPPMRHPDVDSSSTKTSPDDRQLLTRSDRGVALLWDIRTATLIATLRERDERILQCGFSPDSKTVYTQDTDNVVRFWNPDGALRAKTPMRPERFVYPPGMTMQQLNGSISFANDVNHLHVANGVAVLRSTQVTWEWEKNDKGAAIGIKIKDQANSPESHSEIYDTQTGNLIRRVGSNPKYRRANWTDSPDGRLLIRSGVSEDHVLILSATDGRQLARLEHPETKAKPFLQVAFSPTGKWVVTCREGGSSDKTMTPDQVRLWRSSDWTIVSDPAMEESIGKLKYVLGNDVRFVTDDFLILQSSSNDISVTNGVIRIGQPGSWTLIEDISSYTSTSGGALLLSSGRELISAETLQRLKPPTGRYYHPKLAELAPDGRFFDGLDTVTERKLPNTLPYFQAGRYYPGFGSVHFGSLFI